MGSNSEAEGDRVEDKAEDGKEADDAAQVPPEACAENALGHEVATGIDDEFEEGEEGRSARKIPAPQRVSSREREEHELTHTPYRGWCPYCVRGRARNTPHLQGVVDEKEGETKVPRVGLDCFFMSQEDERANENPLVVMLDEKTGDKYARAVGHKGVGKITSWTG